jgi:hypothetical protein
MTEFKITYQKSLNRYFILIEMAKFRIKACEIDYYIEEIEADSKEAAEKIFEDKCMEGEFSPLSFEIVGENSEDFEIFEDVFKELENEENKEVETEDDDDSDEDEDDEEEFGEDDEKPENKSDGQGQGALEK